LDSELRQAVREVMSNTATSEGLARVQELLLQKAAASRAPLDEKVRRIRESA
jgi:hypothetical protein